MATPRVLRFDAEGADPFTADRDRFARQHAALTAWKSRHAAACIALSNLLPESEEIHFTQVRTAREFLTAIKARYATPTTVSLGRLFLPFLFPDLVSFERSADLIAHLRSLNSSYHAACTDAQLALLPPPPMAITIYFIVTSLPDRLASVRDALLQKHPSELTIDVLESALKDVESNLRSVASTSGGVPPPLFHGCTVPQLLTFTASLATAATDVTAAAVTISARSRARSGKRGGQGAGGSGGGGGGVAGGGGGSAGVGGVPGAVSSDSPTVAGGGDAWVSQAPAGTPAAVASVGTCLGTSPGTAQEDASLSFILESGASHCFFRDHTTFTPLPVPVSVALACYSTTLPCPAVPSGFLTGFHVPSFSNNLVGSHLPPGSCVWSGSRVWSSCCVLLVSFLTHPTVLWHHRLGHTSIPRLCTMSSQRLVLGLPRVLPSLPPSPAPPYAPCAEGWLRANPHSSSLRPATEPFETLHLDVWGPASRPGSERESFFLVVVDDYSRHTTVSPLAKKSEVTSTLIRWLPTTADTCGHCVSCLHPDRGESPQQNGVAKRRIGLVMEIARTSLTHARAPHFLWPYADSSDFTFYHPPLHRFLDSRDVSFDESAPYYTQYPCQGLPVPPPPLFLTPTPPPAPPVQPPPPVTRYPPPFDPAGAGVSVEDPRGASSRGVGVGAEGVPVRGPGSGGAGVGAEPMTVGDSSLQGVGVSLAVPGGATTGGAGAPSAGAGELGADRVASGGAGSGGGAIGALEGGPGATTAPDPTPPPQPYLTRHQDRLCHAREEQLELERETLELERQQQELWQLEEQQQQQQHPPHQVQQQQQQPLQEEQQQQQPPQQEQQQPPPPLPVSGLRTLSLPSPSPPSSSSPPVYGPTPPRSSPSVLPYPPESALIASLSTPVTDYYRTYRPVLSHVLASLVTHPRASLSSVSALTAAVTEFATTRHLDHATLVVAAPPTSPLAVGGESALGCDALEDRQFELQFLAAASPHLCAMQLAPEGDPDTLDIPTPRTYAEAVSGPWAFQWRAAMDAEMASYRSTGTYVDEVPPPGANVVDGMWIFRMKRPSGSPPFFKARYVARGFSQREEVDFFQTFAPTPKMTTLRVLLHVAAQRDNELHSLDFSTAFLQGSQHEEVWLCHPSAFIGTFPPGTQWRLRRPVYGLCHAPREWHDTLRSTLSGLVFQPSSADPS
ncbi:unnamed protein product, partial [Closterium sp. NIES-53]